MGGGFREIFGVLLRGELPVSPYFQTIFFRKNGAVRGGNILDIAENAASREFCGSREHNLRGAVKVDYRRNFWVEEKRLDFACEHNSAVRHRVEKGLNAYSVAREEKRFGARVPHGERENAVEQLNALFSVLRERFQHNLGIRVTDKSAAALCEFAADILGVVKFAVVNQCEIAEPHRLPAVFRVNDDKPPVSKSGVFIVKIALVVRTARSEQAVHFPQKLRVYFSFEVNFSCNRAHIKLLSNYSRRFSR